MARLMTEAARFVRSSWLWQASQSFRNLDTLNGQHSAGRRAVERVTATPNVVALEGRLEESAVFPCGPGEAQPGSTVTASTSRSKNLQTLPPKAHLSMSFLQRLRLERGNADREAMHAEYFQLVSNDRIASDSTLGVDSVCCELSLGNTPCQ